mmetsp:Transcript_70407/g.205930  ORF Transcript_70407/g.205930 Transcript_70407/m.205930 type:complete len:402 (-) Transcript_70407:169-1374(-)
MKASETLPSRNMLSSSHAWASSSSSVQPAPAADAACWARCAACQRSSSRRLSSRRAWTCMVKSCIRACRGCTTSACTACASSSSCDSVSESPALAGGRCCAMMLSTCRSSSATTGARSLPSRCPASSCSEAMPSKHLPMRSRKEAIISPTLCPINGASSCSKCRRSSALKTGARDSCRASVRAEPTVSCSCFGGRRASSACFVAAPPDFWTPRASASQNFLDCESCCARVAATPSEILASSFCSTLAIATDEASAHMSVALRAADWRFRSHVVCASLASRTLASACSNAAMSASPVIPAVPLTASETSFKIRSAISPFRLSSPCTNDAATCLTKPQSRSGRSGCRSAWRWRLLDPSTAWEPVPLRFAAAAPSTVTLASPSSSPKPSAADAPLVAASATMLG